MTNFNKRQKPLQEGLRQENRRWFCEICGSTLEIDPESGQQFCSLCDLEEPEG